MSEKHDDPEIIALLALIVAQGLIAAAKPKQRDRALGIIATLAKDASVIPISDGSAKRRSEALRELYVRVLPIMIEPK